MDAAQLLNKLAIRMLYQRKISTVQCNTTMMKPKQFKMLFEGGLAEQIRKVHPLCDKSIKGLDRPFELLCCAMLLMLMLMLMLIDRIVIQKSIIWIDYSRVWNEKLNRPIKTRSSYLLDERNVLMIWNQCKQSTQENKVMLKEMEAKMCHWISLKSNDQIKKDRY